ncbi:hypothetical protein FO519_003881 [Halicephalobus sp. NKZ332]|nr:hypothetical protein FO519_003881 [Halicephalobus sp. NKZ332]
MGAIFGKQKNNPQAQVTEHDKAVLQLKLQRDKMRQAIRRYEGNLAKEKEMARELLKQGRKDRALLLLKRKKVQETAMERFVKMMDQIDQMVTDLEVAQMNSEVMDKLKQGNEALKLANEKFSIEEAQKIMEDTQEAAEYQEEISKIVATELSPTEIAEAEDELEALIQEQLPSVPSHNLPEVQKQKQREKESKRVALAAD